MVVSSFGLVNLLFKVALRFRDKKNPHRQGGGGSLLKSYP